MRKLGNVYLVVVIEAVQLGFFKFAFSVSHIKLPIFIRAYIRCLSCREAEKFDITVSFKG